MPRTLEQIQSSVDNKIPYLLEGWDKRKIEDLLKPNILKSFLGNFAEDEQQFAKTRISQLVHRLT